VDCFTLVNQHGICAKLLSLGATLAELHAPDRQGTLSDITLGFERLEDWVAQQNTSYMGCTVGRYANRIAAGQFTLDETTYQLARNNGTCSLHGGTRGFNTYVWKAAAGTVKGGVAVEFQLTSPDGDEGYPGTVDVRVTYTLTDSNELRLDYAAETDKPTVINLTNHAYWNLGAAGDILGHHAQIHASQITENNEHSVPTGRLLAVAGTPFNFTTPTLIGERMRDTGLSPIGYDNNYIIDGWRDDGTPRLAARVEDPASGRVLEVLTTEPGIQFYTSNYLDGTVVGKRGRAYGQHAGFCLEAQHFPDSPNHPQFPTTVLRPGAQYRQTTIHRFSIVT
jgi:aldose 1-epimerase